jgi:hypothetical protein
MFTADWLSALDRRFPLTNRARPRPRPRRRRVGRRLRVAAELAPLEDRCLMSRSMLGTHPRSERLTAPPTSGVIVMPASNVSTPGAVMDQNPHFKDNCHL